MGRRPANVPQETPGALKSLQDLPRAVKKGEARPLYTLYGDETYLLERLQKELLDALLPKGAMRDFNLDSLDGDVTTPEEITALAETMPMGADRRVIVVKDPSFLGQKKEPTAVERLQQSSDARDAGNLSRALYLLFRALDINPAPLTSPETQSKIAELKESAPSELLQYLDDAPALFESVSLPESPPGNESDRFFEWAERGLPATTVIVLVQHGALTQKRLLTRLEGLGVLANVDTLKAQTRGGRDPVDLFIDKQLKDAGKRMDGDALRLFRERTKDDLQTVVDELEKALAYVGDREAIRVSDVVAAVSDGSTSTVFNLTDAISARNLSGALACLHSVLEQGEPALRVHALFVRQVRLMAQARLLQDEGHITGFQRNMPYQTFMNLVYRKWDDSAMAKLPENKALNVLKQAPYAAYLAFRQSANFTLPELLRGYDLLLAADERLKSGGANESAILQETVIQLVVGERKWSAIGGRAS
ncbi:MAG: hypothetical protein O3A46_15510 [Candidatus Poribacteria bacterium]|nr:hypothetical protein [Candidatus Poribacteria bacterium]